MVQGVISASVGAMERVHAPAWAVCCRQATAFVRIEAAHPVTWAVHVLARGSWSAP